MQQQLEQERLQQMMSAAQYTPRQPRFMSPRQPRFSSPRQQFARGPGPRHEPYSVSRSARRASTGTVEGSPGSQKQAGDGQIIKLEPQDNSNQSDPSTETSDNTDKVQSGEGTGNTTPGGSNQGLEGSESGDSVDISKTESAENQSVSADFDPSVSVKLEALTESELDLEITGVEPGRPAPAPQDWGANFSMDMGFDPSGATGSGVDMSNPSKCLSFLSKP